MKHILFIDPIGGLAGDMLCAALLDAGLDEVAWRDGLNRLKWKEDARITRKSVMRGVFAATHINIQPPQNTKPPSASSTMESHTFHTHSHSHTHGHHSHTHGSLHGPISNPGPKPTPWSEHHRGFKEIQELIMASPLPTRVQEMAVSVFRILGEAEAAIHGTTIDDIHFHEVGAVDSILDIVGFCLGVHLLGIEEVYAGPVPLSSGMIQTAHGRTPLPAPATLRILQGWPSAQGHPNHEQVTPTGAAIIQALATPSAFPSMTVQQDGYGAGTRNPPAYPNLVRVCIGTVEDNESLQDETPSDIVEIQANIDDMSAELLSPLIDRLLDAGALDATLTPIIMKKGRAGHLCTILATASQLDTVIDSLFTHSSTFGCRFTTKERRTLTRSWDTVETPLGSARMKVGQIGNEIKQTSVEFEDARQLAEQHMRSVSEVMGIIQHEHWKQFPHRYKRS